MISSRPRDLEIIAISPSDLDVITDRILPRRPLVFLSPTRPNLRAAMRLPSDRGLSHLA